MICKDCGAEYDAASRKGKPGKFTVCNECGEEESEVTKYTGNMIYSHKTGCSIQINTDPRLTKHLINSTKLKNKGSNMHDNINQCSKFKNKTVGACLITADAFNYKNRNE